MQQLSIEFVSDIACPWCLIGLKNLLQAGEAMRDEVTLAIHCSPFELNPVMPKGGQNIVEHISQKYGTPADGSSEMRARIQTMAAALGFTMNIGDDSRIYNTFDAHRLLRWVPEGQQVSLKLALFKAYFTDNRDPGDHDLLVELAMEMGLDPVATRAMLESDAGEADVRREEDMARQRGINAVPAAIVEGKYLISGGQGTDVYIDILRKIAAASPEALTA